MKLSRPQIVEIEYVLRRVAKQEEIPVNHLLNEINVQQIFFLSYKANISILLPSFFFSCFLSYHEDANRVWYWLGSDITLNILCKLGATAAPG